MSKAYEFNIDYETIKESVEAIKKLREEVQGLRTDAKDASNAMGGIRMGRGGGGGSGGGGSSDGGGTGGGGYGSGRVSGAGGTGGGRRRRSGQGRPSGGLIATTGANAQANSASGSGPDVIDGEGRFVGGKTVDSPFMRMFKRTRFGFGKAQVLGRDIMAMGQMMGMTPSSMAGAAAKYGPAGLAVFAGAKVIEAEWAMAGAASKQQLEGLDAYNITGGSAAQAAQVQALSHGNPGRANELGDLLRGGSYGAARMRAKGRIDLGMWTTNKATNYIGVMEDMRGMSRRDRTMIGRDLNMTPQEYRLTDPDLSKDTFNAYKHSLDWMGNKQSMNQANEFETTKDTLINELAGIKNSIGMAIVDPLTEQAKGFRDILQGGSNSGHDAAERKIRGVFRVLGGAQRYSSIGMIANSILNSSFGKEAFSNADLPQDNVAPGEDGPMDFRQGRRENIGGGSRSNGAIPMNMNYGAVVNGTENDVYRMGAF